jgi:NAD+ synthase
MGKIKDSLQLDAHAEVERIVAKIREDVAKKLRKKGVVIGVSGGIDSSVVLALCRKALPRERVLTVLMPERDSSSENFILTRKLLNKYDSDYVIEDMTDALAGFGCYRRRDEAIQKVFPEYDVSYKAKIVLKEGDQDNDGLNYFKLMIISPEGEQKSQRIPLQEYLQIVAASNFKQRSRMAMLYYHAEARNFAVVGTANKNEHEMGFFVKHGDGGADLKPIVHLFKSQVYQIAEVLDIPAEIRERVPTSDTYSAEQTQEEFFFRLSFDRLDLIWNGMEKGFTAAEMAEEAGMPAERVQFVMDDLKRKIQTTEYLRMPYL